jgi:hypothetical protein
VPKALWALSITEHPVQMTFHASGDLFLVLFGSQWIGDTPYMSKGIHKEAYLPADIC